MPYKKSTLKKGKKRYVLKSLASGKTYHYSTAAKRKKAMKIHEMFKHMPKSKIRIAKKTRKTRKRKKRIKK